MSWYCSVDDDDVDDNEAGDDDVDEFTVDIKIVLINVHQTYPQLFYLTNFI